MNEDQFYKLFWKVLVCLVLALALCRFTAGGFALFLAVIGVWCALTSRVGIALCCYVFMPLIIVVNPLLLPYKSMIGYAARFGPLLIGCCLAVTSSRRVGRHRLPFGMIVPFLLAAVISSVQGWLPKVSILKLINFSVFLLGIWIGTQNLHNRPKDVMLLRAFFLAITAFTIWGSVFLYPFPSYSRLSAMQLAARTGDMALAKELAQSAEGASALFCGVLNQSQALAPIAACCVGWCACDMLFIQKSFDKIHLSMLVLSIPLIYLTRSRCGLLALATALVMVGIYCVGHVEMSTRLKQRVKGGVLACFVLIVLAAIVAEIVNGSMTRWIRKRDDTGIDKRSITEAFTSSRQGLIAESMKDFRRNPIIGMGFQVSEGTRIRFARTRGLIISASIEKGVLPTMVLGETGVLGFGFFLVFLGVFYFTSNKKKFVSTIALFTVFISTNMGESTFFSPGGIGGIMWMICLVGGFTIDTLLLYDRNLKKQMWEMNVWNQQFALRQNARYYPR